MTVGRLSLGTAHLGMPYGIAGRGVELTAGQVTAILQHAADHGITGFDTAPDYGLAEQRLGAFLLEHDLSDQVTITTKLPSLGSVDPDHLTHAVEEALLASLRRLAVDNIDCYLIHDFADLDRHGQGLVDALQAERDRGRVVDIGVSVYTPDELAVATEYPELGVVQHPFNLLDRRLTDGDWPQRLAASGVKLQVRSVLLQGLLAMGADAVPAEMPQAREAVAALETLTRSLGIAIVDAAIAFALSIEPDRVVIAARSAAELDALVAAAEVEIPDALADRLADAFRDLPAAVIDPRKWPAA